MLLWIFFHFIEEGMKAAQFPGGISTVSTKLLRVLSYSESPHHNEWVNDFHVRRVFAQYTRINYVVINPAIIYVVP
jgi:hypothetical protein